ncbi:MAG: GntR family transcriptional regulator, partial [Oleiphilaceae bacterium]
MNILEADARSHEPLYIQIKLALKKQILSGEYAPYERLPSESELMSAFGVSRITVRQALKDLSSEGLVFTSQGKGTFASKPKASQDLQQLQGFDEAMSPKGYKTSARLISIRERVAPRDVQIKLELGDKEKVIEVVRIRYLNQEAVSLDRSFFPIEIGQGLFGEDLTGDIFPMLEKQLSLRLGEAEISLEARPADEEVAQQLGLEQGSPLMWVERLTRD